MLRYKVVDIQMDPNLKLFLIGGAFGGPKKVQKIVRTLNYLTMTRPNITYQFNVVS